MDEIYYVYRKQDGGIGRIAKFEEGTPYGYENGKWIFMPALAKIQNEVTDYEEISKEEAEKLIKEL